MPRVRRATRSSRRKSRRMTRRRQVRKYRGYSNPGIYKPYSMMSNTPLPIKYCTKLKYSEAFTINPGLAAAGVYPFRANSLYDPNASAGGHQPYGFDQLIALYQHFCVVGAKITFRVSVPANNDTPFIMGIHVDDQGTLTDAANITALMEQPRTTRKIISKPNNASGRELQITQKFSAKKFFGANSIIGESQFEGSDSANPTEEAYFIPWIGPMDATSDLATYTCFVEIEYVAVFTEPKDLNQS